MNGQGVVRSIPTSDGAGRLVQNYPWGPAKGTEKTDRCV